MNTRNIYVNGRRCPALNFEITSRRTSQGMVLAVTAKTERLPQSIEEVVVDEFRTGRLICQFEWQLDKDDDKSKEDEDKEDTKTFLLRPIFSNVSI